MLRVSVTGKARPCFPGSRARARPGSRGPSIIALLPNTLALTNEFLSPFFMGTFIFCRRYCCGQEFKSLPIDRSRAYILPSDG